ncbi:conjugative transposon protein TraJ [Chitinophaga sp. Ak27]|uniref:conjugative transposon protein TraJ n=1 Tax=Chitinophaga sp. Ak27 TaxID=2726116 RepID=UPI001B7D0D0C|nr:conjugative transposon protein TraJ [Chitinophaga sp. Ak27]
MKRNKILLLLSLLALIPMLSYGQGTADSIHSMQDILDSIRNQMMSLSSNLINTSKGIAGFAALFYIAFRVWRHIQNAEPIDFYPLFRPFVLGFCIAWFPTLVIGTLDGLLQPVCDATSEMVQNSNQVIKQLLKEKEKAIKDSPIYEMYVGQSKDGDRDKWYKYTHNNQDPSQETWYDGIGNSLRFEIAKGMYKMQNSVKEWMNEVLRVLFETAALCINTLRTFQLIVLAILGPLVFGIAVFDGLGHTLGAWIAKYINIFLWLPVANIFGAVIGKIQEEMIKMDIGQINQTGDTFFSQADTGYLAFLIIGIVGYFTVPSVAGFVVNAGGGGALVQKISSLASSSPSMAMSGGKMGMGMAKSGLGAAGQVLDNLGEMRNDYKQGRSGSASGYGMAGAIGRVAGYGGAYMADKLSGKKQDDMGTGK